MIDRTIRQDEALTAFMSGEKRNAVDIWSALADEGDVSAAWKLGLVHFNGLIADDESPDFKAAAIFFRQAAEKGHCLAASALGHLLYFGCGIERDESEARRWLESAAEQGDDAAQCGLGFLYETGAGGEEDFDASFEWYRKAADHGNAEGQYRLALAYLAGRGISHNGVIGLYWLIKASEQGHPSARESRDKLLPFIDDDIAKRVFELTLERSSVLH